MFNRFIAIAALSAAFATSALAVSFSKTNYSTGTSPFAVASADINRDGHPDLITADHNGFLTVLLGASGGTFVTGGNFPTADTPEQLAVGDFNNDGYPDVVVLEDHGFQLFLSAKNGALIPQTQVPFASDVVGESLAAVDLNKDHIPDIAFSLCPTDFSKPCSLFTDLNDGTGHFRFAWNATLSGRSAFGTLTIGDFDLDGNDDLALGVDNTVQIFHTNGNGSFNTSPFQTLNPNNEPVFALAAGDIDAKHGYDLVVASSPTCFPDCNAPAPISVYLNNGSGTMSLHQTLTSNSDSTNELKLVDLTGDNRLDLVLLNGALQENNGSISWAHYSGGGSFSTFSTIMQLGMPMHMTARDLNLDSRHDIALTDGGFGDYNVPAGTAVLLNTGSGAYCPSPDSSALGAALCFIGHTGDTYTFEATSNSPTGVRRMELWVDGHKLYNSPDDRLQYKTTLTSGSHKTEIVAVDQFGAKVKLTNWVTAP